MANQSKLKAWVRVDGTGTVVLAGPIFSVNKPKDGKWKQISNSLCCGQAVPGDTIVAAANSPLTTENGDNLIVS